MKVLLQKSPTVFLQPFIFTFVVGYRNLENTK